MTGAGPPEIPRRWIRGLVRLGAVASASDLRFAAFSLGEVASAALYGSVEFVRSPAGLSPPAGPSRTGRPHSLAVASRRSGIVAVSTSAVLLARARTAYCRPTRLTARLDIADVWMVEGTGSDVWLTASDRSVARFSFIRTADAAAFIGLW